MTWYYELEPSNDLIRLRFKDDDETVHGPRDINWPDAPALTTAPDGWPVDPNVQEEAGNMATVLYTQVNVETALMALRDLAAGKVEEGVP